MILFIIGEIVFCFKQQQFATWCKYLGKTSSIPYHHIVIIDNRSILHERCLKDFGSSQECWDAGCNDRCQLCRVKVWTQTFTVFQPRRWPKRRWKTWNSMWTRFTAAADCGWYVKNIWLYGIQSMTIPWILHGIADAKRDDTDLTVLCGNVVSTHCRQGAAYGADRLRFETWYSQCCTRLGGQGSSWGPIARSNRPDIFWKHELL